MKQLFISLVILVCTTTNTGAQNSLSIQLDDGEPFKVLLNDKVYNKSPQAQVLISDLKQDTVHLKVELEKGQRFGLTFYLLEKGKPTDHKEFSYLLKKEKTKLKPVFMGIYELGRTKPVEGENK